MKKLLVLVGLALLGTASWYIWETRKAPKDETPEQAPIGVSRYSPDFIASIDTALADYYDLSETLVRWDSTRVDSQAEQLKKSLEAIKLEELEDDTLVRQTAVSYRETLRSNLDALLQTKDLTAKRQSFHSLSQNLYDLLRAIRYDGGTVYLQECPMAFYDTVTGIWLSKTAPIRNPYLGLYHPRYRSGMLECGETKDSIFYRTVAK
ncbi:MAG TPA: DUF3347 domain-containing protein [Chitinophagaceae bacterium]